MNMAARGWAKKELARNPLRWPGPAQGRLWGLKEKTGQNHGGARELHPRRPFDPYSIRSVGMFAVASATRAVWRSKRWEAIYFLIRPSSFMITSYSTIFFFTRAREASGPINSVLKPF